MNIWRILWMCGAISSLCYAEPTVRATLAGVRCLFPSPHDGSRHRLVLQVDVEPGEQGWFVNEVASRASRIRGRDSTGNYLTSEPCHWVQKPHAAGVRTAYFTFLLSSKISRLDVNEKLEVQLAEKLGTLPLHGVDLLQESSHRAGEITFLCRPGVENADEKNREKDGSLHRAKLAIICPPGVDILSISRMWKGGKDEETGADVPPYSQELDVRHSTTSEGVQCANIVLWDSACTVDLEITTCMNRSATLVPVQFSAVLGDPAPAKAPLPRSEKP